MNTDPQPPKLTIFSIAAVVALLISIGSVLWNAAVLSNQVAANHERITVLEREVMAERERRDGRTQQLATIEVKLDLLLEDRERKRK